MRCLARITADPAIFDDHFASHQLVLPEGLLFRQLAAAADGADNAGTGDIKPPPDRVVHSGRGAGRKWNSFHKMESFSL